MPSPPCLAIPGCSLSPARPSPPAQALGSQAYSAGSDLTAPGCSASAALFGGLPAAPLSSLLGITRGTASAPRGGPAAGSAAVGGHPGNPYAGAAGVKNREWFGVQQTAAGT